MAVYAIGDLQGCYEPFRLLLDKIRFDPANDTLWLTGDLVNRGPHSLATLRFVRSLGDSAITVLGNHDLHLLALAERPASSALRKRFSLNYILQADDAQELLHWLRSRPLMHYDSALDKALVHAGILPSWSIRKANKRAAEVESVLRSDSPEMLLRHIYGNKPVLWHRDLTGVDRLRYIVNVFTRMRMLTRRGGLDLKAKGPPPTGKSPRRPWFEFEHKRGNTEVVFGHWSALGYVRRRGVLSIDTGCVWGRSLTAVRLDKRKSEPVAVDCPIRANEG
ncbi:MAG: symmetrical bis(5'-nucleosyl)-tetraphosphatase [Pseudomonadota bacterium]